MPNSAHPATGGHSSGLAACIRACLAGTFGPEWATRTAELDALRRDWRARGLSVRELAQSTDHTIEAAAWMP